MFIHTTTHEEITFAQLKERFPLTLFPDDYRGDFEDYVPVMPAAPPEYDPATHKVLPAPAELIDGAWQSKLKVVPLTQQEIDDARRAAAPQECTPAQGLVALYALKGITDDAVHAAIAAIAEPVARYTAQIAFARTTTWQRSSATMQQLAAVLALSSDDLDALFAFAVKVAV